jgi:hypothetical protein
MTEMTSDSLVAFSIAIVPIRIGRKLKLFITGINTVLTTNIN